MEKKGYDRNVVILTRPANYVKEPASMMRVISRVLQKYPETVQAMEKRHIVYNETLAYIRQREAGKYAFVIRPETDLDVGRVEHDRYKIREAYKAGRRAARRHLDALRRFLEAADKDQTATTSASIIANAPVQKTAGKETAPEETAAAQTEKKDVTTPALVEIEENGVFVQEKADSVTTPALVEVEEGSPLMEKKEDPEETARKEAAAYRAVVFPDTLDEADDSFERPQPFVDRQQDLEVINVRIRTIFVIGRSISGYRITRCIHCQCAVFYLILSDCAPYRPQDSISGNTSFKIVKPL